jgi:hypothetical protein
LYEYGLEFLSYTPCENIEKFRGEIYLKIVFVYKKLSGDKLIQSIKDEIGFLESSVEDLLKIQKVIDKRSEFEETIYGVLFIGSLVGHLGRLESAASSTFETSA